jgi:hypothetical protein
MAPHAFEWQQVCCFCVILQMSGFDISVSGSFLLGCDSVIGLMFPDIVMEYSAFLFNCQPLEVKVPYSLEM